MSASDGPNPPDLVDELGVSPEEAQLIADAMAPLQDLTGIGSSLGSAMANTDAVGPQFAGAVLESIALQVNLASTSAETVARALDFYIESQQTTFTELFPPPDQLVQQVNDDAQPLVEAIARQFDNGPP